MQGKGLVARAGSMKWCITAEYRTIETSQVATEDRGKAEKRLFSLPPPLTSPYLLSH